MKTVVNPMNLKTIWFCSETARMQWRLKQHELHLQQQQTMWGLEIQMETMWLPSISHMHNLSSTRGWGKSIRASNGIITGLLKNVLLIDLRWKGHVWKSVSAICISKGLEQMKGGRGGLKFFARILMALFPLHPILSILECFFPAMFGLVLTTVIWICRTLLKTRRTKLACEGEASKTTQIRNFWDLCI